MIMRKKNNKTAGKALVGAVVAGAAGYVAGVLTAPKSGKQTRKQLAEKANEMRGDTEDQLKKTVDELKEMLDKAKDKTMTLSSQAKEEYNETVLRAKDAQKKGSEMIAALKAGKADDPELDKAIKQAKQAKKNLAKFLKGEK